jgi:hypothetical protein
LSPVEGQDQSIIIGRRFVRGGAAIPWVTMVLYLGKGEDLQK